MRHAGIAIAVSIALVGCAGNGEGLDENGRPLDGGEAPLTSDFASIQQHVFTPICTQCHAGAQAPLGLRLDEASSYAMLVNAPSVEVPALQRVRPGDPDASYLIHKIEGTAAVGGRMPLNGPALPSATIAVIRQWIADGAQRPAAMTAAHKPAALRGVSPGADEILERAPVEVLIEATAELDTTQIHRGTVALVRSGRDGSFDEGNEIAIDPLRIEIRSLQPTVVAVVLPRDQWIPDSYQLTVMGGGPAPASDLTGAAIDGDADGSPGGNFVLRFELGGTL